MAEGAKTKVHGKFAGNGADGGRGNRINAALADATREVERKLPLHKFLSTTARAQQDSDLPPLLERHGGRIKARIPYRLTCCRNSERHHTADITGIFFADVLERIEIGNFPGNLHRQIGRVKRLDATDSASSLPGGGPEGFSPHTIRADGADAGHDYSTLHPRASSHDSCMRSILPCLLLRWSAPLMKLAYFAACDESERRTRLGRVYPLRGESQLDHCQARFRRGSTASGSSLPQTRAQNCCLHHESHIPEPGYSTLRGRREMYPPCRARVRELSNIYSSFRAVRATGPEPKCHLTGLFSSAEAVSLDRPI